MQNSESMNILMTQIVNKSIAEIVLDNTMRENYTFIENFKNVMENFDKKKEDDEDKVLSTTITQNQSAPVGAVIGLILLVVIIVLAIIAAVIYAIFWKYSYLFQGEGMWLLQWGLLIIFFFVPGGLIIVVLVLFFMNMSYQKRMQGQGIPNQMNVNVPTQQII